PRAAAAPAPVAEQSLSVRLREGALKDIARLPSREVALAVQPPEMPEGVLFAPEEAWRFGAYMEGGQTVLAGPMTAPEELVAAIGSRAPSAPAAKSLRTPLATVPGTLAHDPEVAAYRLEPARRGYPFRELTEERGLGTDLEDRAAHDAVLMVALAKWQREEIRGRGLTDLLNEVELPLVRV